MRRVPLPTGDAGLLLAIRVAAALRAIHRAIPAAAGLALALASAITTPAFAQTDGAFVWDPTAFPVEGGGSMPFFGGIGAGFTSAKFRFADLDKDGDLDFYSLDLDGRIASYENVGSASNPQFVPKSDNIVEPPITAAAPWFLFADIDGDGTPEMFGGDQLGESGASGEDLFLGVYRNEGTGESPHFRLQPFPAYLDSARVPPGGGNVPAFVDLDLDDDLDLFYMNPIGTAAVHWNLGTRTEPFFSSSVNDYGGIDSYIERFAKELEQRWPADDRDGRHGTSIPTFHDVDEDSDFDLIMGDVFNTNLFYFRSDGTPDSAAYTKVTQFLLEIPGDLGNSFSSIWPEIADLDANGSAELFIAPSDGFAILEGGVLVYENENPGGEPVWAYKSDTLVYGIDLGAFAMPVFGDIDDDGDFDMLLSRATRVDIGGTGIQGLVLFENVGTSSAPAFRRLPPDEDPFASVVMPELDAPGPALADMDGDGDLDLLVVQHSLPRQAHYYENQGTPSQATYRYIGPVLDPNIRRRPDFKGAPTLGDLDRDGDLDLLIGEYGSTGRPKIYWYDNTGTFAQTAEGKRPVFSWVTSRADSAFGFDTGADSVTRYLVPNLFDGNCDGYLDIWVGASDGRVREYRSRGVGDSLRFDRVTNLFEGILVGGASAPEFVDIDADGDFDMFVGEQNGGVNFYRNESGGLAATPTTSGVLLEWTVPSSGPGMIEVLRAEGDGPFETIAEVPQSLGPQFAYVDTAGLVAVTRYRYQLDAQGVALACGAFGPVEVVVGLSDVEIAAARAIADSNGVRVAWTVSSGYPGLAFRLSRSDSGGEFTLVPGGDAIPRAAENVFDDPAGSAASRYRLDALYLESGAPAIAPDSVFTPLVIRAVADCALDATPTQSGIDVEWRAEPEETGAFQLSRAENEGSFAMIAEIPVSEGPEFVYEDSAAGYAGNRYSYKLDPVGTKTACASFAPVEVDVAFPESLDITSSVGLESGGARIEWSVANPYRGLAFRLSRSDDGAPFMTVVGGEAIPDAGDNSFFDPAGAAGASYRLEPLFRKNGGFEAVPDSVLAPTLLEVIVVQFRIFAPSPNPARGPVEFFFDLPSETSVALTVFDVSGRRIREMGPLTLASGAQRSIVWDGRDDDGSVVSNGLYIYRIEAGDQTATGRVVHLR